MKDLCRSTYLSRLVTVATTSAFFRGDQQAPSPDPTCLMPSLGLLLTSWTYLTWEPQVTQVGASCGICQLSLQDQTALFQHAAAQIHSNPTKQIRADLWKGTGLSENLGENPMERPNILVVIISDISPYQNGHFPRSIPSPVLHPASRDSAKRPDSSPNSPGSGQVTWDRFISTDIK